ncbi:MAG: hypothetical protein R2827_15795 [Bdellovibrionales bacterium]
MRRSVSFFLILIFLSPSSFGFELFDYNWNIGLMAGLGGTGIQKGVTIDDEEAISSRSETPGMFGVSIETVVRDQWSMSIQHRRGFRFGPFSAGVGVTDVSLRWYYLRNVPTIVNQEGADYVINQIWSPYVGGGAGIAFGSINRDGESPTAIDSSGIVLGLKVGADYHWKPNLILRPEFFVSGTFMNSSAVENTIAEFGIVCAAIFPY